MTAAEKTTATEMPARLPALIVPQDDARDAKLGSALRMDTLRTACTRVREQYRVERANAIKVTTLGAIRMNGQGRITTAEGYGGGLPIVDRALGVLLTGYTTRVHNKRAVIAPMGVSPEIDVSQLDPRKEIRAMQLKLQDRSARACAVNDYLSRSTKPSTTGLRLRTRDLMREDGEREQAIVAVLSPSHSLTGSDDPVLVGAIETAFAEALDLARAQAWRGIDETEIRVVFPHMPVDALGSRWTGYMTVRNSETGKCSWSISAGLYREQDGASLAVEATGKTGRHVGFARARMISAAETASEMLRDMAAITARFASQPTPWSPEKTMAKLQAAMERVGASEEAMGAVAMAVGCGTLDLTTVVNAIATAGAATTARGDAIGLERLAGRMLIHGWEMGCSIASHREAAE